MKPHDSGALDSNVLPGEWPRSFTFQPQDTQRKPCPQQGPGGGPHTLWGQPSAGRDQLSPPPPPHGASSASAHLIYEPTC